MDKTLIKTLFDGAAAIGVQLGEIERERFALYHREILLWNRRINLVSDRSLPETVTRHFLDSLTAAPFLEKPAGALIDLGSGGGFPGLPLRIAFSGLDLTLVEASRKKSSFLSHVARTLQLDRVEVIRERVEEIAAGETLGGCFDTVISRAAFKLPELIRAASFFLKPGGQLIALKGVDPQPEIDQAATLLDAAGMRLTACRIIRSPGANSTRNIIIYNRASR